MAKRWEIVGGADKGGVLVRQGQGLKSPECSERLSTGAIVEEVTLAGERLHYRLVNGTGPAEGWISLKVGGKDLAVPAAASSTPVATPSSAPDAAAGPELKPAVFGQIPEHLKSAIPESKPFPVPKGKCFGKDGKMKMVFLHGGGVSKTIGQMQLNSLFADWKDKKSLDWTIWTGPHSVPLGWNGDFSLKPFGPNFSVYFERDPFANCQMEHWDGIDKTVREFKDFLKQNGPFDGVVGFDMGGEFLVHVAKLASEGDADLQEKFRFMILFTTTAPKHLSPLGKHRITSPLRIPSLCSWANSDENHPYMEYEELPLFIHRDFREVIVHADGHKPPILKKEQEVFHRVVRFLDAMQSGSEFTPSDHEDNHVRSNLWLPLVRSPQRALASTASKRLIVVPDPEGPGDDLLERIRVMKELKGKGELVGMEFKPWVQSGTPPKPLERLELLRDLCSLTEEQFKTEAGSAMKVEVANLGQGTKWSCGPERVPTRQLMCKDIIDDEALDATAKDVAKEFVASFARSDDEIALVGLGTGAFIAWTIARMMVESTGYVPAALYLVNPPLRLPWACTAMPGVLQDCSVHFLVDENSTYGPAWRYEVSTLGVYKCYIFDDVKEVVQHIVHGFRKR